MGTDPLQFSERLAIELERLLQVASFHVCIAQQTYEFHIVRAILCDLAEVGQHLVGQRAGTNELVLCAAGCIQIGRLHPTSRHVQESIIVGRISAQAR